MNTKRQIITSKITNEERETVFRIDYTDKIVTCTSTIPKHFNRCLKQGWTPTMEMVNKDGAVVGMELTAPDRALSIRSTTVHHKTITEEHKQKMLEARKALRTPLK